MTKSELKQYRILKKEITQLEELVQELRATKHNMGTFITGMPKSTNTSDPTAKKALLNVEIDELLGVMMLKRGECLRLMGKIEDAIGKLKPIERMIIRKRYIYGEQWEQIAVELNYCERQVRRFHTEGLEKMSDNVH